MTIIIVMIVQQELDNYMDRDRKAYLLCFVVLQYGALQKNLHLKQKH